VQNPHYTLAELQTCEEQLTALERDSLTPLLRDVPRLHLFVEQLRANLAETRSHIENLKNQRKTLIALQAEGLSLANRNSLIDQLLAIKLHLRTLQRGQPAYTQAEARMERIVSDLNTALQQMPAATTYTIQQELTTFIANLRSSDVPAGPQESRDRFKAKLQEIASAAQATITRVQGNIRTQATDIPARINTLEDMRIVDIEAQKQILKDKRIAILPELDQLKIWATDGVRQSNGRIDGITEVPIVRINSVDMSWFTDVIKNAARGQIEKRVDGLVDCIKQPRHIRGLMLKTVIEPGIALAESAGG
jgi:hypothetical protein